MHALKELRNIHGPAVLRERLAKDPRPRTTLSFYRYVRLADPVTLRDRLYAEWDELGVLGGRPLGLDYPGREDQLLLAVTELHTREDLDDLVRVLRHVVSSTRATA